MFSGDRNESQPSTSSIESSQPCRHFKFHEILLATNNFDESLVIGHGGFGKVYKGNLIINGSTVSVAAIKRLDPMSSQGESEFWAEVEMLSNFRHCHLVSLFGYCNHGKEMILVYEYMPNGTLDDHLHKLGTLLSWLQRLKICIGAARGLDYLHTGTGINVGVIHRDVKSSNILLHESWAAKISDFGLSKIGPTNQPLTYVNTRVKGTFGYLDPDYSFTGMLTRKSDVYAFGVVLLELLCRKRAVDGSFGEEPRNLARWAQESIKEGNLKHIIDSGIKGEINPKCLKEFVRIAERCLLFNPKQRPNMAEVVVSLNSVLILQEKADASLQAAGKTIFGKMLDIFPSPSSKRNTSLKVFKFVDLERATRQFSQDLLLASDYFGDVFSGWVDKNTFSPSTEGVGIAVAVRRYNGDFHQEWQSEVSILGCLDHPNIIRLLGYSDDKRSQRLIVNECMPNQDLCKFLYGDAPDVATRLSWGTRIWIMIGVARALVYMHSLKHQIIHIEVTPSNIFLDQDFNAKLGSYGTRRFNKMDNVNVGSDIYSFGVLLLEVLTGQQIYFLDKMQSGYEISLAQWASSYLEDTTDIEKMVDPCLEQSCSREDAFECATLAVRCLAQDPKDRPLSEQVLRILEQIYARND